MSPTQNLAPIQSIEEVQDNCTITTRNEENSPDTDIEEVEPILETLRHVSRNPNIRNDVDYHG